MLSVLLAVAAAKPKPSTLEVLPLGKTTTTIIEPGRVDVPVVKTALIQEPGTVEIKEPTLTKVGDLVRSVPTAVSHQSSTIVHSKADIVEPIIAQGVRTYQQPIVKTFTAPVIENVPISTPIVRKYETPLLAAPLIKGLEASPLIQTYAANPLYYNNNAFGYYYGYGEPYYRSVIPTPLTYSTLLR